MDLPACSALTGRQNKELILAEISIADRWEKMVQGCVWKEQKSQTNLFVGSGHVSHHRASFLMAGHCEAHWLCSVASSHARSQFNLLFDSTWVTLCFFPTSAPWESTGLGELPSVCAKSLSMCTSCDLFGAKASLNYNCHERCDYIHIALIWEGCFYLPQPWELLVSGLEGQCFWIPESGMCQVFDFHNL